VYGQIAEEIALELARLQRAALARVRRRMSEQQLGEAWKDLAEVETSSASLSRG
jgi:hypothetical protein